MGPLCSKGSEAPGRFASGAKTPEVHCLRLQGFRVVLGYFRLFGVLGFVVLFWLLFVWGGVKILGFGVS